MQQSDLKVGMLVVNPRKPEWGPGRVCAFNSTTAQVMFRDLPGRETKSITFEVLSPALDQEDEILDNMPPLKQEGERFVLPAERIAINDAIATFLNLYRGGFSDPKYLGDRQTGERNYKVWAHEQWEAELGNGQLEALLSSNLHEAVRRVGQCLNKVNLLFHTEKAALSDALKVDAAARQFLEALSTVLRCADVCEAVMEPYFKAVINLPAERGPVATWPVATLLPFLAQPHRHMHIKPTVIENAAKMLAFNLNYRSEPNWLTYSSGLRLAELCHKRIAPLEPRDMIDIQSFLYITCGGKGYKTQGDAAAIEKVLPIW